jgi:drug/metabolite transporter (DMT)-like permease
MVFLEFGVLAGLGAAVCWGLADFFDKIAVSKEKNFMPIHIAATFGFLAMVAINLLFPASNFSFPTIIWQIAPVSLLMSFGWWLFMLSLWEGKITVQSAIGASYGLITLPLGMLVLKEYPLPVQILGAIILIASIFLLSLETRSLRKISFNKTAIMAICAMVCWGVAFILLAPYAKTYPPQIAVLSHTFFSMLFSWTIVLLTKKRILPTKKIHLVPAMLAGVDVFGLFIYYWAAATFLTSLLAPISSIYPLFTAILAYFFMGERLKNLQIASIVGVLVGIILISL